jgi:hypothetical protein
MRWTKSELSELLEESNRIVEIQRQTIAAKDRTIAKLEQQFAQCERLMKQAVAKLAHIAGEEVPENLRHSTH